MAKPQLVAGSFELQVSIGSIRGGNSRVAAHVGNAKKGELALARRRRHLKGHGAFIDCGRHWKDCVSRLNVRETRLVIWNVVRKEPLCKPEAPAAPAASAHCSDALPFSVQFCQQTVISTVEDNVFKIDAGVRRAPLMDQNLRLFAHSPTFTQVFVGGRGHSVKTNYPRRSCVCFRASRALHAVTKHALQPVCAQRGVERESCAYHHILTTKGL